MRVTLIAAAIYNVAWGGLVVLSPSTLFEGLGVRPPDYPALNYPQLWQCIGMIVGVYGVGYFVAARDPLRHWPIVLVGFLGKIFGPIGFADAIRQGVFPVSFGWNIVFNDLIWWFPFGMILYAAWKRRGPSTR